MQIWHKNFMTSLSEPSYEVYGPDAYEVRDNIEIYFSKKNTIAHMRCTNKGEIFNLHLISKCIDRIVPVNRNDFGSWRGYASFRMEEKLIKQIKNLYNKKIKEAYEVLTNKFMPYVKHTLYKPHGIMWKKTKTSFYNNVNRV